MIKLTFLSNDGEYPLYVFDPSLISVIEGWKDNSSIVVLKLSKFDTKEVRAYRVKEHPEEIVKLVGNYAKSTKSRRN